MSRLDYVSCPQLNCFCLFKGLRSRPEVFIDLQRILFHCLKQLSALIISDGNLPGVECKLTFKEEKVMNELHFDEQTRSYLHEGISSRGRGA